MTGELNPFAPPDETRTALGARAPAPEEILASFDGSGIRGEKWKVEFAADQVSFYEPRERDHGLTLTRSDAAAELRVGAMGPKKGQLVAKQPKSMRVKVDRHAMDFLYTWLGEEVVPFRQRILRASWAVSFGLGIFFIVGALTVESSGQRYSSVVIGGLLTLSGALGRFTDNPISLLASGLAWFGFSTTFVVAPFTGSPIWTAALGLGLYLSLPRYYFLYRYLAGRSVRPRSLRSYASALGPTARSAQTSSSVSRSAFADSGFVK